MDYFCSDFRFHEEISFEPGIFSSEEAQVFPEFIVPNYAHHLMDTATDRPLQEQLQFDAGVNCYQNAHITESTELVEPKNKKGKVKHIASLGILNSYGSEFRRLSGDNLNLSNETRSYTVANKELSTEEIMRIACAHYLQLPVPKVEDHLMVTHSFYSMFSSSRDDQCKDLALVHHLLASAEKVSNQQYDQAKKLLRQCDFLSSCIGNPIERIVYYFTDALCKRIDIETSKGTVHKCCLGEGLQEMIMNPLPTLLVGHTLIPLSQVMQFTEIQAIIDNVSSSKTIHLIDIGLRTGVHWTILMQALAVRFDCPVELLKISAVGTSKDRIEETGKWLINHAETLKLPFTFNALIVSDMKDIKEDIFDVKAHETICIYASIIMRYMIVRPDCLDNLMNVIKRLNPSIMIVSEVEANHNSLLFVNRFVEALFFYSAWFDCLDAYMDRNDCNRMSLEVNLFSQAIRCIVATEGIDRVIRHVKFDVWRAFFSRYSFVEVEMSELCLNQAVQIVKQFACASSWTLDMNEKCLIIGWKGTPMLFVSAWKLL